jgi:hypothetical protein
MSSTEELEKLSSDDKQDQVLATRSSRPTHGSRLAKSATREANRPRIIEVNIYDVRHDA